MTCSNGSHGIGNNSYCISVLWASKVCRTSSFLLGKQMTFLTSYRKWALLAINQLFSRTCGHTWLLYSSLSFVPGITGLLKKNFSQVSTDKLKVCNPFLVTVENVALQNERLLVKSCFVMKVAWFLASFFIPFPYHAVLFLQPDESTTIAAASGPPDISLRQPKMARHHELIAFV